MRTTLIALLLISLTACQNQAHLKPDAALEAENGVYSHQLDNGLKVLVKEVNRAPVVVSQIWYKVGGSYEHDGITGVSHVLEHMMFKGTSKRPEGDYSELISANGGKENAFTSKDYTAYFQRIASDRLEICLEMEADRMRNLLLREEDFLKELEVVKEERRLRTEDKPIALTYERFNSVAYNNNPYRQPIIGWMQDLDTMTVKDMETWYRKWYAPNNATLVIVGDVKAAEVFRMAEHYFADLEPSVIEAPKPREEAKQLGTRRVEVKLPAKLPFLMLGYKVPSLNTASEEWEVYALEVLAGVLDGGSSARLTRELVRGKEMATSASAGYSLSSKHETLFTLSAIPADGVTTSEMESALLEQVARLQQAPADQDEIDRVIAQVLASNVYEQDSSFYQAMKMGVYETIGLGWQKSNEYIEKVRAVTAQQIQQVAQKYLVAESLTVGELVPQPIDSGNKLANNQAGGSYAH